MKKKASKPARKRAAKPRVTKKKRAVRKVVRKPVLLSGGNPQIAKAEGDAPVQAYISAINHHNYLRAWNLGGRFTSSSFASYKAGFAGTQHDTLTILSVSGNVVTAHLAALQTDGTVKNFETVFLDKGGCQIE